MDIAPQFSGSASGLMNVASPLAAIISPLLFGYLIDRTDNWISHFSSAFGSCWTDQWRHFGMRPEKEFNR
jgi:MFS family permease